MTVALALQLTIAACGVLVAYFGWSRARKARKVRDLERQNQSLEAKADALQDAASGDLDDIRQRLRDRASG